ncbi:PREDICTED: DET1- and DDB1-associated protein 1 isoform X2 [Chinchilla lanigera]|nr:PREDICTED: DET1- and DDB1-associated protein 1 isoform X2 [Chinchilla lanigera]
MGQKECCQEEGPGAGGAGGRELSAAPQGGADGQPRHARGHLGRRPPRVAPRPGLVLAVLSWTRACSVSTPIKDLSYSTSRLCSARLGREDGAHRHPPVGTAGSEEGPCHAPRQRILLSLLRPRQGCRHGGAAARHAHHCVLRTGSAQRDSVGPGTRPGRVPGRGPCQRRLRRFGCHRWARLGEGLLPGLGAPLPPTHPKGP